MQLNLDNFDKSIIVPFSTVDWPGKASMVVFLRGCSFRCCYCQNYKIWGAVLPINVEELLREIERNRDYVNALVFSGGEPTLRPSLLHLLAEEAKEDGLLVGIETNGTNPEVLDMLIDARLLDGLFIDLKAPLSNPQKYARIVGIRNADAYVKKIGQAIDIGCAALAAKKLVDFELRTTLFKGLLSDKEIVEMVNKFQVRYALQQGRAEMCARGDLVALARHEIVELAVQCRRPLRIRTREKGDEGVG
ncbi:MAG TPA: anaerobic ribonucleoside-triphosphate reductase activating protein [Candidatus Bathyarchaeia archaeon]|nr:anaerobic ribonucleoside-triphosphate reductase activating protein [Candidatus Bathyarchaeia archaeon]